MHGVLRLNNWLAFFVVLNIGVGTTLSCKCFAQAGGDFYSTYDDTEPPVLQGAFLGCVSPIAKPVIKRIPFNPDDYYILDRSKVDPFSDRDLFAVSLDVESYIKENRKYDTIDLLRKNISEAVISPESPKLQKFLYPELKVRSVLTPSKKIDRKQQLLCRKSDKKSPVSGEFSYIQNQFLPLVVDPDNSLLDFLDEHRVSYIIGSTVEKKDDFEDRSKKHSFDELMYESEICLNYRMKNLQEKLNEFDLPRLQGATNGTIFTGKNILEFVSVEPIDLDKNRKKFLLGSVLSVVNNPKVDKRTKYRALMFRLREIDKQLYSLSKDDRLLLSDLYRSASRYAPNAVVRQVCLGKASYFAKDWLGAWRHYETVFPKIRENESLVGEIAFDYYAANRAAEGCIWLTRYIDIAPSKQAEQEFRNLRRNLEYAKYDEYLKKEKECLKYWPKSRFPLKVYVPDSRGNQTKNTYAWEFEHALFQWMNESKGKLSYHYVANPKDADIKVVFEDVEKRYAKSYSADTIPKMHIRPAALGLAYVISKKGNPSDKKMDPIESVKISFFLGMDISDHLKVREVCLHEIGHALGLLSHSKDKCALMYPYISGKKEKAKEVTNDERKRLNTIYRNHPVSKEAYQEYVIGLKANCLKLKKEDLKPRPQLCLVE